MLPGIPPLTMIKNTDGDATSVSSSLSVGGEKQICVFAFASIVGPAS